MVYEELGSKVNYSEEEQFSKISFILTAINKLDVDIFFFLNFVKNWYFMFERIFV